MSKFLDEVEQCFGTRDLYAVLGVGKTAKESELKRAYHRLSLQVHPDRVTQGEVEEATRKFQVRHYGKERCVVEWLFTYAVTYLVLSYPDNSSDVWYPLHTHTGAEQAV